MGVLRAAGPLACSLIIASIGFVGCGDSSDGKTADAMKLEQQRQQDRADGARDEKIKELQRQLSSKKGGASKGAKSGGTSVPAAAPAQAATQSDCGGGLKVNSHTSCPFAASVRDAYNDSGPGAVEAWSSTTNQSYTMNCSGIHPTTCTGGNGAAVYLP